MNIAYGSKFMFDLISTKLVKIKTVVKCKSNLVTLHGKCIF